MNFYFGDSHSGYVYRGVGDFSAEFSSLGLDFSSQVDSVHASRWIQSSVTETGEEINVLSPAFPEFKFSISKLPDKVNYFFSSPFHGYHLLKHPFWDEYRTYKDLNRSSKRVVSLNVIDEFFSNGLQNRFAFIKAMKNSGKKIFVLEPPAPLPQTADIFDVEPVFLIQFNHLYRNYVRNQINHIGANIIATPPHTYDERGFTLQQYAEPPPDEFHGSLSYSREILMQIYGI